METNPPPASQDAQTERRVLRWSLALLCVGSLVLLLPFWPWLLLALWTASIARPLSVRLMRAVRGRRSAAAVVTIGLLFAMLIPFAAGVAVVTPDIIELVERAKDSSSSRDALMQLVSGNGGATKSGGSMSLAEIVEMVRAHGKEAWTIAALVAGTVGAVGLGVLMFFVGTYAALVHGATAYTWVRERLPLSGAVTDRLREAYVETGRGLLYSVVLTAAGQAALATIAFLALGVPRALALGLLSFVTSIIPAIGPFLVWGPVALGLFLADEPVRAAILAGVGTLIVAPADNVLRPWFAKRGHLRMHPFLVFFSMLGGIVLLGPWGLILGPLVFRMALEVSAIVHERRTQGGRLAPSLDTDP